MALITIKDYDTFTYIEVDDDLVAVLSNFSWHTAKFGKFKYVVSSQYDYSLDKSYTNKYGYNIRKPYTVFLHQVVYELKNCNKLRPDQCLVFKNGNRLCCTIDNIVVSSKSDAIRRAKAGVKSKTTGYKGVRYSKSKKPISHLLYIKGNIFILDNPKT